MSLLDEMCGSTFCSSTCKVEAEPIVPAVAVGVTKVQLKMLELFDELVDELFDELYLELFDVS